MNLDIRARLSLSFTLIVAAILILFSASIYYFSATYRESEFYTRLSERALNTAELLIRVNEVDLDLLRIIDRSNKRPLTNEKITVYDSADKLIYFSPEDSSTTDPTPHELLERIRSEEEVRFNIGSKEALGLLYKMGDERFVVIASGFDRYGQRKMNNLKWVLILAFFTSIGITVVAGMIYAGRAMKPMRNVVDQVDRITFSSMDVRVDEGNGRDEIAALAITFNKMLERLESAFHMQRSFVSNASHELRTPLTAITGQIEVSLLNKRSTEEYEKILRSVLDDIRNLNSLANGLLDLAKASSDISEIRLSDLRIDELLWECRSELLRRNPGYTIDIQFDGRVDDEKKLIVKGNEQLLKTAINNLMDNGCKYSGDSRVKVRLVIEASSVQVVFADNGIGISPEDLPNIFNAFYRAANTKHYPGHGLGLSLTERILFVHNGQITVDSTLDKGTTVTIQLPVIPQQSLF